MLNVIIVLHASKGGFTMYLFLVDYNFIASEQLQKMIEGLSPGADIVNCFSAGTLLKVADKLKPHVIILDYDLIGEDGSELLGELRARNEKTHVLALIEPGSYDKLYRAIEEDLIDDYMVKPVNNDEFTARIYIATRRTGLVTGEEKAASPAEETAWDKERLPDYEEEALDADIEQEGIEQFDEAFDEELETTVFTKKETNGEQNLTVEPAAEEEPTEEAEDWAGDFFADVSESIEQDNEDSAAEHEQDLSAPVPGEEEREENLFDLDVNGEEGKSGEYGDLFARSDQDEELPADSSGEEDLFFGEASGEQKTESKEEISGDDEAVTAESDEDLFAVSNTGEVEGDFTELFKAAGETGREDEEDLFGEKEKGFPEDIDFGEAGREEKIIKPDSAGGPAVFKSFTEEKPAEEGEGGEEAPSFKEGEAEDKYFDELFSEEPVEFKVENVEELHSEEDESAGLAEETVSEEGEGGQKTPRREIKLPGESADDFLYGESEPEESLFDEDTTEEGDSSGDSSEEGLKKKP